MTSRKKSQKKSIAAREGDAKSKNQPSIETIKNAGRAAALLLLAGAASPVSQLNLSPVYGSIPAALHHQMAIMVVGITVLIGRRTLSRFLPVNIADYVAVIAYWTPVIQFFLFQYSNRLGVDYGSLMIESCTYFPFLFATLYAANELLDTVDLSQFNLNSFITESALPASSYIAVSLASKFVGAILPPLIGQHISMTRLNLQLMIASASAAVTPSKLMLLAFPAILHTLWANPHHASDYSFQKVNATLSAQNFTLVARQESNTGYISVIESQRDSAFRILRCDHSLLGGEWQVTPFALSNGQTQRETIFSVFVLLEAVRLMEPVLENTEIVPESQKKALNIGLGIGTAPNALISHGIDTTIVELDPMVHFYATRYFDLSPNHTAVIEDAVGYVNYKSKANPKSFDFIIHDVFTGGAEPVALFTQEFLQGLYDLLADDGVVALNYAGDIALDSTRLVLNTIHSVFPACRLFRDAPRAEDWKEGDPDFINMVVFCVKDDHGKGTGAIKFRAATQDDFRGSLARRNFLEPRPQAEIKYTYIPEKKGGSVMRKANVGELEKWHKRGALSHWKIMRDVLPDIVWETW